jgi:hypothetical protein
MDSLICRTVEFSRRHAGCWRRRPGGRARSRGLREPPNQHRQRHRQAGRPQPSLAEGRGRHGQQFPQDKDLLVVGGRRRDARPIVRCCRGARAQDGPEAGPVPLRAPARREPLFSAVRPALSAHGSEVQDFADHLISAQPFLGTLAADPSVRGVLDAIDLLAQGALAGASRAGQDRPAPGGGGRCRRGRPGREKPAALLADPAHRPEGRRRATCAISSSRGPSSATARSRPPPRPSRQIRAAPARPASRPGTGSR